MDFRLNEDQMLFKNSIERFVNDTYGTLEQVDASHRAPHGFDNGNWAQLAELGLLAIPFAEADGGLGGGAVETAIVMEALGKGLAPEPYFAGVVLSGTALRLAGSPAQREAYIPPLIEGTWRAAFAHAEVQARYDLFDVATSAQRKDDGFSLNGTKVLVLNAEGADAYLVSARTSGAAREATGISLFLVATDTPGLSATHAVSADGGRVSTLVLDNVFVSSDALIGEEGKALVTIEAVVANGVAALAAEAVGIMDALTALTVDYLKQRKQFGTSISAFQTLQHRAVDMLLATEHARSMAYYAMMMVTADPTERDAALSAVKVQINKSARFVGQQAVQLHGGIGMTMEYLGAHYFRRLTIIETMFGDTHHHLGRLVTNFKTIA